MLLAVDIWILKLHLPLRVKDLSVLVHVKTIISSVGMRNKKNGQRRREYDSGNRREKERFNVRQERPAVKGFWWNLGKILGAL